MVRQRNQPDGRIFPSGYACRPLDGHHPRNPATPPESHTLKPPDLFFCRGKCRSHHKAQSLDDPFGPIEVLTEPWGLGAASGCRPYFKYQHPLWRTNRRTQTVHPLGTHPPGHHNCPRWPGCSYGFNQTSPSLDRVTKTIVIGKAVVQAFPLSGLVRIVTRMIQENPLALLCNDFGCERCNAVRK